jgi:hypothetical protein
MFIRSCPMRRTLSSVSRVVEPGQKKHNQVHQFESGRDFGAFFWAGVPFFSL